MTVAELRKALDEFPDDYVVYAYRYGDIDTWPADRVAKSDAHANAVVIEVD